MEKQQRMCKTLSTLFIYSPAESFYSDINCDFSARPYGKRRKKVVKKVYMILYNTFWYTGSSVHELRLRVGRDISLLNNVICSIYQVTNITYVTKHAVSNVSVCLESFWLNVGIAGFSQPHKKSKRRHMLAYVKTNLKMHNIHAYRDLCVKQKTKYENKS